MQQAARSKTVVYAGWIQRRKGLRVAVQALAEVRKTLPDAILQVIGEAAEPDYVREVEAEVAASGLSRHVRFRGRVSREEVQHAITRAAAVVVPEQWENVSPVIVTEALALGAPVVASAVGGIGEIVTDGQNGFLVERNNTAGFAVALVRLLQQPELNATLSRNAVETARHGRSREDVWNEWRRLYTELTEGQT